MGAAAGDFGFYKLSMAAGAGLTFATKNLCEELEVVALRAVSFDVSPHGGTAGSDGFVHDIPGGFEKGFRLLWRKGAGAAGGVNPRGKEGFVGIDVAEAADDGLVEDGGFNSRVFVFLQFFVEFGTGHFPRFFGEFFDEGVIFYFLGF